MIGRLHHVIVDTADPAALARFWSAVLGMPVTYQSDDFVVVAQSEGHSGLAFQLAPDHVPPRWPDPAYPQQVHLDVMVDDLEAAAEAVERLGARRIGDGFVYADPSGHPFCLIPRPGWAAPVETAPGPRP